MKKLLICASRVSHIVFFHLPYIKLFRENGWAVDIAAEGAVDCPFADRCYDLKFVKNPFSLQNLKTIRQLAAIMKENSYDTVYSNSTLAGAAMRMAVKRLGKKRPYCIHISHGYMFDDKRGLRSALYRTAERLTSKVTDRLIVMNDEDLRLAERYKLGSSIYFTDGMGLCTEKLPPVDEKRRTETRYSLGAEKDSLVFLCVGEFSSRKNQALIIEALERTVKKDKGCIVVFAGQGGTLDKCRELVNKYELETHTRFLGQVSNVNLLYRSADALISASEMEGLPFNVMEALYCGTPVIASDIKGHSDLIRNGFNGLLFSLDNIDAAGQLSQLMLKLSSDRKYLAALRSNTRLDEKYTIDRVGPQLFGLLSDTKIKTPEVQRQ